MSLDQPRLKVELEELANQPAQVRHELESYSIESDYTTPTDGWEFTVHSDEDPAALRTLYSPFQPIRLYIDDNLQLVGRIDRIEGTGQSGADLRVSGRDYLADIVTGSVDPTLKFKKSQDIGSAILATFNPFGIVSILPDGNNTNRNILTGASGYSGSPPRDFKTAKLDEFKPSYNEGAFEVGNKIAARHGFTIQPTLDRAKIALVEPEYRQAPSYSLSRTAKVHGYGTVLHAHAVRDYGKIPTLLSATGRTIKSTTTAHMLPMETIASVLDLLGHPEGHLAYQATPTQSTTTIGSSKSVFGAGALSDIGKNREVIETVFHGSSPRIISKRFAQGQKPEAGNGNKLYRPLFYQDKDSRNQEQLERGIKRQLARRLKDTLVYRCTLRGHSDPDTGTTYAVDTIARVDDDIEGIHENLWIESRHFYNEGQGPRTDLLLIRPGSYVL